MVAMLGEGREFLAEGDGPFEPHVLVNGVAAHRARNAVYERLLAA